MIFREAQLTDIPQLHRVRVGVRENRLSDPARISPADYEAYLTIRGKGWVGLSGENITGFAIVDLQDNSVWALFVDPEYERQGIGQRLHDLMLSWYFRQTQTALWLSTAPDTRAEGFYEACGWGKTGLQGNGEVRFEMPYEKWNLSLLKRF